MKECEIVYTDYELRDFQEWKQACKLVASRMLVMKKIINPAILEITEKYNEKMRERTDRRRKLVIFEEGDHLAVKEVVVGKKTDAKWTTGYIVEKRNQNGSYTVRERCVGGVIRPDTYTSDKLILREILLREKTKLSRMSRPTRLKGSLISPRVEERPTSTRFDGRVMISNTTPGSR